MSEELIVYGFETSNNFKVRVALGYKAIPYRFETIDPRDRSRVESLSGQPLTPVMAHGETVLFDSSAILRYLDANFPGTLRLFAGDRDTIHEIEAWEAFARRELHEPVKLMVDQRRSGVEYPDVTDLAARRLHEHTARLEDRLADRSWLVGEELTAADAVAAPVVFRALTFEQLRPLRDRERTCDWMSRVMAYDELQPR